MAIWDTFLTDRDKAHLEIWGKKHADTFGAKPVLLVVDVYYASVGHERKPLMESIKDWPMSCGEEGWQAIDKMAILIAGARKAGVPVIYVHGFPGFPSDPSRVAERGKREGNKADRLPPEIRSLSNQIVKEVEPQPQDMVIGKAAPSAFSGTVLLQYLQILRADTVIVCGESTSGFVRAAVVDASSNRFKVGVVEDCCYDRTQASHAMNLFDMHQKYAEVVTMNSALRYFDLLVNK